MDNNNQVNRKQRKDVSGVNNPMYGRTHSQESRNKMSQAAQERNRQYQKLKDSQHHITMDEFLSANPSVKEYISHLVRQQIQEMIWRKEKNL